MALMRSRILNLIPLLVYFALVLLFHRNFADDAYIVARYARNFVAGEGIVFNPGEPVSALTSPLHFAVISVLQAVTPDPIVAYRILSALAVPAMLAWAVGRVEPVQENRAIILALALASPFVAFWAVGGLETPLLLMFVMAIAVACLAAKAISVTDAAKVVALAGLCFLTRYDSCIFTAPVVVYVLWTHRRYVVIWTSLLFTAAVVGAWLTFSQLYFQDILPTSFYTKSPLDQSSETLQRGALYLTSFLVVSLAPLLLMLRSHPSNAETTRGVPPAGIAIAVGLLLYLLYAITAGTKHMMYAYRLYVPFIPVLFVLWISMRHRCICSGRGAIIVAVSCAQLALGAFIYHRSLNVNISWLFTAQNQRSEIFEYSGFGARYNAEALDIFRKDAEVIAAHWQRVGPPGKPSARIFVLPGGVLPYFFPKSYIYETLVSYRHQCRYDMRESAHYMYLIYPPEDTEYVKNSLPNYDGNTGWERISQRTIFLKGLAPKASLNFDVYFTANPKPNRLPAYIDGICLD